MTDPREPLGRLVHATRLVCEADRAAQEGRQKFLLGEWEDRSPHQHELDMRIGSAVAARAVHDAVIQAEADVMELARFRAHLPAILDALRVQVADTGMLRCQRARYVAALEALGGGEAGR